MNGVLSTRAVPWGYTKDNWGNQVNSVRETVNKRDSWKGVGEPPFREDLSAEAEEYPLLQAVARERLEKA
jgi:hypothetical protein